MARSFQIPRNSSSVLLLLQPLFFVLAVWALLPKSQPALWVDVPVIIIAPDGSERVLWQGEDRLEIQNNIESRMAEITSILFSNPQDTDLVRQKIAEGLKLFSQGSEARQHYLSLAARALTLAGRTATAFVKESSSIRYVEKDRVWNSDLHGTWTWTDDGVLHVQKLRVEMTFKPSESLQKSKTRRALFIADLRVAYEN